MNKDILVFDKESRRGYSVKRLDRSTMLHFCMSEIPYAVGCISDTWICSTEKAEGVTLSACFSVDDGDVIYQWMYEANGNAQQKRGVADTRKQAIDEALAFLDGVNFDCDTLPHEELPGWTLALLEGTEAKYDYIDTMRFRNPDDYALAKAGGELWIVNGDDQSSDEDICIDGITYKSIIKGQLSESLKLNQSIDDEDEEMTEYLAF